MEHKTRGAKHYTNKNQKYKPAKYNQASKSSKQKVNHKQAAALESNWHKYESDEEDTASLTDSTNFALLAEAAITQGSHFQFRSDKTADFLGDVDLSSNNAEGLFKLNLELLDKSLSTIPLTKRCGIDEKYFTENQRKTMEGTAADNLKAFKAMYAPQLEKCRSAYFQLNKKRDEEFIEELINGVGVSDNDDGDDSGNEIDGAHQEDLGCATKTEGSSQEQENLENWLDDLLAT